MIEDPARFFFDRVYAHCVCSPEAMALRILALISCLLRASVISCSQILTTAHPAADNCWLQSCACSTFLVILRAQYS